MRCEPVRLCGVILTIVTFAATIPVRADVVQLGPSKDNTLYEDAEGDLSNGKGQYTFAGISGILFNRRAVMAFDVAGAIPAGATIRGVQLVLVMDRTTSGPFEFSMHRLVTDWGEGESLADGQEGSGGDSKPGDATWIHTFYKDGFWADEGGDFEPVTSATITIDQAATYTWGSTEALVADVQAWLDVPASNFGWLIREVEEEAVTAKRFGSRENRTPENRPVLMVEFDPPACTGQLVGDSNCDGLVDFNGIDCFVAAMIGEGDWLNCGGGEGCDSACVNDTDGSGEVNFEDIDGFIACLIENGC